MANYENVFKYLREFDWIHSFQVTNFFTQKIWTQIPIEWVQVLLSLNTTQLKTLPFQEENLQNYPESLRRFLRESRMFSIPRDMRTSPCPELTDTSLKRGLNSKKLHEVSQMSTVVNDVAREANCDCILDIGSGLGYVNQVLHKRYGYPIVAVEGCTQHSERADIRASKQDFQDGCIKNISYRLTRDEANMQTIEDLVMQAVCTLKSCNMCKHKQLKSSEPGYPVNDIPSEADSLSKFCMIGLHCCGDLTAIIMKYFLQMDAVCSLCVLSCCYHKMEYDTDMASFAMFPLSESCNSAYNHLIREYAWKIGPVSLRLAAQETRSRWLKQTDSEQAFHTKHVAYRGLLEVLLNEEQSSCYEIILQLSRKDIRQADYSSYDKFIETLLHRIDAEISNNVKVSFQRVYQEYEVFFKYIEVVTCLQAIVQPVLESLVLYDRQSFLTENNIEAQLTPIFDENTSPRNIAIIARKSVTTTSS